MHSCCVLFLLLHGLLLLWLQTWKRGEETEDTKVELRLEVKTKLKYKKTVEAGMNRSTVEVNKGTETKTKKIVWTNLLT